MSIRDVVPTWTELRRLGESRVLRTAYLWFVLVPIAARVIERLNDEEISWWVHSGGGALRLPFSWQLFFFASVFFSVGTMLYRAACPKLIREYPSWRDVHSERSSDGELAGLLAGALRDRGVFTGADWRHYCLTVIKDRFLDLCDNGREINGMVLAAPLDSRRIEVVVENAQISKDRSRELAALVWHVSERRMMAARAACTVCYSSGAALIALVAGQNIQTVFLSALASWQPPR